MIFFFNIPSRKSGTHSYDPVPGPDEETLLASPRQSETLSVASSKPSFLVDPSFWLTTIAVLSIAITCRNLLVIQLHLQESPLSYVEASIGSPYNGLEKFIRNSSSPSWPLSSTHYPDFIGATEDKRVHQLLSNGSVVRLDAERTVVVQHRVRDYGLEHCALRVEFSRSHGKEHGHAPRAYGHIGKDPYLSIWRLEGSGTKAVLASSALPAPLPVRKDFIGNITLDGIGPVQSPSFRCHSGSVQTIEIAVACASDDPCIMEFRLTRSPQRQGFWVVQSEDESAPI